MREGGKKVPAKVVGVPLWQTKSSKQYLKDSLILALRRSTGSPRSIILHLVDGRQQKTVGTFGANVWIEKSKELFES